MHSKCYFWRMSYCVRDLDCGEAFSNGVEIESKQQQYQAQFKEIKCSSK